MPICTAILPEFDAEMANTRKVLELVPDDNFAYRPHEKSMTMARLASHVAELPSWAAEVLKKERLDLSPEQKPFLAQSRAELLDRFERNLKEARAAIESSRDEDYSVPWTLAVGGHTVFTIPRAAVLRTAVMNHLIHHRAQLGVYLRLNQIPVPGLYGPSADDQQAFFANAKA
ncbi:MAG TPA: DinB family protein [Bryobacteraceae bacterium]|nr:DinB family protein [Bryobacteraceae bacterium]